MAIPGLKGYFYCIQKYFLLNISKNRGGTLRKGGGARPKVAHRERTRLVETQSEQIIKLFSCAYLFDAIPVQLQVVLFTESGVDAPFRTTHLGSVLFHVARL